MLKATKNTMNKLRQINKSLGTEKIDSWADQYLDEYRILNKKIVILTPWSISPRLSQRYEIQGKKFIPTTNEEKIFRKEIPYIISIFAENGFRIDWWIYFSRSYLDATMLNREIEKHYTDMILSVKERHLTPVEIINWEDDVIKRRHFPNNLLIDPEWFCHHVSDSLFQDELLRRATKWFGKDLNLTKYSQKAIYELEEQTRYKIACEAEEGRILIEENPFDSSGKFIFVPVGVPEKYNFFSVLTPEFKKRLVFILKPYPWRL